MHRVIVDTGLWVSALLKAPFRLCLETVLFHSDVRLLASPALMDELTEVVQRPRFRRYFPTAAAMEFIGLLEELAEFVTPQSTVRVSPDPDDDFLLALALDGQADVLLTGNKKDLLDLKTFGQTRILTLTEFLAELDGHP